MRIIGNCIDLGDNRPLWASKIGFPEVLVKAVEGDLLEIRDCVVSFNEDGLLVIRPRPGVQS